MTLSPNSNPSHLQTSVSNTFYYQVNDTEGKRYCHCGAIRDAKNIIEMHPGFTYQIKFYSMSPRTVDVTAEHVKEYYLPESELQELFS